MIGGVNRDNWKTLISNIYNHFTRNAMEFDFSFVLGQ